MIKVFEQGSFMTAEDCEEKYGSLYYRGLSIVLTSDPTIDDDRNIVYCSCIYCDTRDQDFYMPLNYFDEHTAVWKLDIARLNKFHSTEEYMVKTPIYAIY